MKQNDSISEYRDRLNKTLSSHDLTNVEKIRGFVKNQFAVSSQIDAKEEIDNIVEIRTTEVSNFLGMLRSTSDDGWNVKQDTEEHRVMYREGPEGSPFHTLLVEGYVDGPVDVCLCISWEAELYPKWWPQTVVPAFKITSSRCLKKMRAGEQICLIRMKVSWPLSAREALVHYFEFEYFQDDLVIVLLNSISDLGGISESTHGFTRDGIPDAENVIRIDVIGGFAIQKVSANRSFFRTIANLDIKLDFIPPAFINFISRQLVGSGFKLYKKEVASVTKGDDDFGKALIDPLYVRIREAKYNDSLFAINDPQSEDRSNHQSSGEQPPYTEEDETGTAVNKSDNYNNNASDVQPEEYSSPYEEQKNKGPIKETLYSEIEEIKEEEDESMNIDANISPSSSVIRPEVEKALSTLEMAMSVIRERGFDNKTPFSRVVDGSQNPDKDVGAKECVSSYDNQIDRKQEMKPPSTLKENTEIVTSIEARSSSSSIGSRRRSSNSNLKDTHLNKIAPASPNEDGGGGVLAGTCQNNAIHVTQSLASRFSTSSEKITHENYGTVADQNIGIYEDNRQQRKERWFRCLRACTWQRNHHHSR